MSFTSTYNSASVRGWISKPIGYSLFAASTSNTISVATDSLVTTANANVTTMITNGGGNNRSIATKNANNTITIANSSLSPPAGEIRTTQSNVQIWADGGINANGLFNNGYITGPMGTYYGTVTNQWLGAGLAISEDANVIVATQVFPSNSVSQARIWRLSGNTYNQSNITISPNVQGALYSDAALNGTGNVLLVTNYFDGAARIWEYDSNSNVWSETANLSVVSNVVGGYGRYPCLNYEGNVAIIPSVGYNNGVTIWKKTGNAWASSAVNLFTTANSTSVFGGQRVTFGDNGNILGTTNIINNKYYLAIYTNYTGNYELLQLLENPYSNAANTEFGAGHDMTPDGKWIVVSASSVANSFIPNRVVYYYK